MADKKISQLDPATSFLPTQIFPDARAGLNEGVLGSQLAASWGWDFLGSTINTSAAHETAVLTLTWPPGSGIASTRKKLEIYVFVPSYGGTPDATGDIASIRFNGDSGSNYWSHHATFLSNVWVDVPIASTNLIRLGPSNSRLSRNVVMTVNNVATRSKTCAMRNVTGTNDATLVGEINIPSGEWVNSVDQITTVQLINAGSNNMGSGAGFFVLGRDF